MPRGVYVSYDRQSDIWRAHVFVQSVCRLFFPKLYIARTDWQKYEMAMAEIRACLANTAVTVILIGSETDKRPWVRCELEQSLARGNGLFGIYIHDMEDHNGDRSSRGQKPIVKDGFDYPAYDWDLDSRKFWKEVKAAKKKTAKLARPVYFPSLGW
jgi:hypothetical protein